MATLIEFQELLQAITAATTAAQERIATLQTASDNAGSLNAKEQDEIFAGLKTVVTALESLVPAPAPAAPAPAEPAQGEAPATPPTA